MRDENRQSALLAKAKEAEERAAKARDPDSRKEWLKIAAAYRQLASQS
jgi:uncharacterized alpha-E superfamily protein